MKMPLKRLLSFALGLVGLVLSALATPPVVSNVRSAPRPGTKLVEIQYDLAYAGPGPLAVSVLVSTDGGTSYALPASSFSGPGYGSGVTAGANRQIVWDAAADRTEPFPAERIRFRVVASEIPPDMAFIPPGPFAMGDPLKEGNSNETPLHKVYLGAFYMDRHFVTKSLWDRVYQWALNRGYSFENAGLGKAADHPVHTVNWYDVVKWCNARSEIEGLTPCYYTSPGRTTVYRTGQSDLANDWVDWSANGYRLPTEAEWEKAARGGASGHRFPWTDTDTITHSRANYYSTTRNGYDMSPTRGYYPFFHDKINPFTNSVGYFAPNGYGLFDMAGNIWQWCWDLYDSERYGQPSATEKDTRGPDSNRNGFRVMRGGSWHRSANFARCAHRGMDAPDLGWITFGFRCAKGL